MKVQRLRITFSRGDEMKYITHLDLMRFWERALRRAGVPIAYSEGFSPHAQIAMAAPLPVGTTSDAELMDVFLAQPMTPRELTRRVAPELPAGAAVVTAEEVGMALPALQAEVRFAEYLVDLVILSEAKDLAAPGDTHANSAEVELQPRPAAVVAGSTDVSEAIERFMAADTIPWEHKREDEVRSYDIRALVDRIDVLDRDGERIRLRMRLRNDSSGSGRPEQVVAALGLGAPARIHRTKLVLAGTSMALDAWRKRGRFAG
jgi:hypothetical protein